jgi:hypothetical protein
MTDDPKRWRHHPLIWFVAAPLALWLLIYVVFRGIFG